MAANSAWAWLQNEVREGYIWIDQILAPVTVWQEMATQEVLKYPFPVENSKKYAPWNSAWAYLRNEVHEGHIWKFWKNGRIAFCLEGRQEMEKTGSAKMTQFLLSDFDETRWVDAHIH